MVYPLLLSFPILSFIHSFIHSSIHFVLSLYSLIQTFQLIYLLSVALFVPLCVFLSCEFLFSSESTREAWIKVVQESNAEQQVTLWACSSVLHSLVSRDRGRGQDRDRVRYIEVSDIESELDKRAVLGKEFG